MTMQTMSIVNGPKEVDRESLLSPLAFTITTAVKGGVSFQLEACAVAKAKRANEGKAMKTTLIPVISASLGKASPFEDVVVRVGCADALPVGRIVPDNIDFRLVALDSHGLVVGTSNTWSSVYCSFRLSVVSTKLPSRGGRSELTTLGPPKAEGDVRSCPSSLTMPAIALPQTHSATLNQRQTFTGIRLRSSG